ncbi:restriction endonuclease subunit S [Raineyella sp. W15-4]|uniref:restriction endonuclease subunit S n=1 Tax=Raineyella sp. W15-4 TaxID=3081651 RepID=UPI00295395BA|nr:restriction endonuclease subunit S [Raineyella sp. W15-4]WOQ16883.1 restriction endonuclease subunit S [Raineyella sp. W15-4]
MITGELKSKIDSAAKQTTGIASINMTQLKALPVGVPPLEIQQIYLERVKEVSARRAAVQRALAADDALRAHAFRGEL